MAKRRATTRRKKEPEKPKHICDDCTNAVWITEHWDLDLHHKPICFRCKYRNEKAIIRGEKACDKWQQKPKEAEQ